MASPHESITKAIRRGIDRELEGSETPPRAALPSGDGSDRRTRSGRTARRTPGSRKCFRSGREVSSSRQAAAIRESAWQAFEVARAAMDHDSERLGRTGRPGQARDRVSGITRIKDESRDRSRWGGPARACVRYTVPMHHDPAILRACPGSCRMSFSSGEAGVSMHIAWSLSEILLGSAPLWITHAISNGGPCQNLRTQPCPHHWDPSRQVFQLS